MNKDHETKCILVVDENENDARLFQAAANENWQADVLRTGSGKEGIKLLEEQQIIPSLVVLELDLPSSDGYGLLRFIRDHAKLHTVPVVVLTRIFSLENLDPAWTMGANAAILKPESASELRDLVKSLCDVWLRFSVSPRSLVLGQI